MTTWFRVQGDLACTFCPSVITFGRWARVSTRSQKVVWCQACAEDHLQETPPAEPAAAPQDLPLPAADPAPSPGQATLFELEPNGPKYASADARRLLEEARRRHGVPRREHATATFVSTGGLVAALITGGAR